LIQGRNPKKTPTMPMSKVVGIIPARWASTRFPGKALHGIAGKPLIRHVWERCVEAGCFDRIVIATDDMRIAEAGFNFGAEVAVTAADHPSGTDRIAEVARKLKKASIILNVQGDEPLVDPALLRRLARKLKDNPSIPIVTAATSISLEESASEHNVKVVLDRRGDAASKPINILAFTVTSERHCWTLSECLRALWSRPNSSSSCALWKMA
jgi:3-deoxy-manno-octulosonate cytidylyltransferase (CMP-KDO synthetase)